MPFSLFLTTSTLFSRVNLHVLPSLLFHYGIILVCRLAAFRCLACNIMMYISHLRSEEFLPTEIHLVCRIDVKVKDIRIFAGQQKFSVKAQLYSNLERIIVSSLVLFILFQTFSTPNISVDSTIALLFCNGEVIQSRCNRTHHHSDISTTTLQPFLVLFLSLHCCRSITTTQPFQAQSYTCSNHHPYNNPTNIPPWHLHFHRLYFSFSFTPVVYLNPPSRGNFNFFFLFHSYSRIVQQPALALPLLLSQCSTWSALPSLVLIPVMCSYPVMRQGSFCCFIFAASHSLPFAIIFIFYLLRSLLLLPPLPLSMWHLSFPSYSLLFACPSASSFSPVILHALSPYHPNSPPAWSAPHLRGAGRDLGPNFELSAFIAASQSW